ncbi:MAG: sulfurtransferase-like selenium metabolism protein YedF [Proteobacteria bacterium]|nr:sulfurtransferase-like selenium metabolism protein YedF [Pseudomonadota bacterium]MBU2226912.1 sulfurtransferase-like selenium metabolism protein YedF [Pseudomonadota bacterium]MBU2260466.1 sulfurtransferase-like selenium metabolism protein YedF [Pseudomonadota bacterium]
MKTTVDARGLACPQPVLLAKKAIAENEEVIVLVDNPIAVENIRRLAEKAACGFSVADKGGGTLEIALTRKRVTDLMPVDSEAIVEELSCASAQEKGPGPFVVVLSDNHMGRGDDVLGDVLIQSFIHTLLQLNPLPDTIICYNAGVKLAAKDSAVLDDLQQLVQAGVNILVCGTCVNYFTLGEKIAVGHISNMYDIAETMAGASRLVRP